MASRRGVGKKAAHKPSSIRLGAFQRNKLVAAANPQIELGQQCPVLRQIRFDRGFRYEQLIGEVMNTQRRLRRRQ